MVGVIYFTMPPWRASYTAPIPHLVEVAYAEEKTIPEYIQELAPRFGQNATLVTSLARCESGLNPRAINHFDGGSPSYYLFQFKVDTWNRYEEMYYEIYGEHLDMQSPYDSIKLTSYIMSIGGHKNWTNCFRKLGVL